MLNAVEFPIAKIQGKIVCGAGEENKKLGSLKKYGDLPLMTT